jgi:Rod binding domain-containing protein
MTSIAPTTSPKTTSIDDLRKQYQSAIAGTFFRTMLKSLHAGENKPAYMHGGMTEDIFRSRLDDQMSEILAETHGEAFAQPFFDKAQQELTGRRTAEKTARVAEPINVLV